MNLKYYSSISPDECIRLCNPHFYQDIDHIITPKIPRCPFSVHSPPLGIHCSDLFHHRLVLSILELLMTEITQRTLLCWYFLLNMFLHFIHVVVYNSSSLFILYSW